MIFDLIEFNKGHLVVMPNLLKQFGTTSIYLYCFILGQTFLHFFLKQKAGNVIGVILAGSLLFVLLLIRVIIRPEMEQSH